jgi:branched-chain amino acid transport system permease protein
MLLLWLAALFSGIAALLIGALSLRTTGVYFIMITLAFAQMFFYFAISWPAYGGEDGLSLFVRSQFFGLNTFNAAELLPDLLRAAQPRAAAVRHARPLALRPRAAGHAPEPERVEALGIRPYRLRLVAFVISGMITGLAGALYADLNRFVSPAMLDWHLSGEIIVFVILGGMGRLMGPIAGAALWSS